MSTDWLLAAAITGINKKDGDDVVWFDIELKCDTDS